ncbi:MAG: glycosyltransferase [Flavobacteriales bacterium]|nr:glycosyltransferase [Flavobacteriales bacterium]MDW8432455.1 glycosyltransferase [Flavobacteriales bacterium]
MTTWAEDVHLVAHNVPWPPDNGGLIDVFFKIKALAEAGARVHLHAFAYGRQPAPELERLCASVRLYPRDKNPARILSLEPFIVAGRRPAALLQDLQRTAHPILFDTLHTTAFLDHPALQERMRAVRTHNVEHRYYRGLACAARPLMKKVYYSLEAIKLHHYEKKLRSAGCLFAISPGERAYFERYGKVVWIPPFHPHTLKWPGKTGDFALYHGHLGVEENQKAALWLVRHVWSRPELRKVPLVVAGQGAPAHLKRHIHARPGVTLREDVTLADLEDLIGRARLHVLPSFQSTGVKLKLIAALASGRAVLANRPMVAGTGLEMAVRVADGVEEFARQAAELFELGGMGRGDDWGERERLFAEVLNNAKNAERMLRALAGGAA